MTYNVDEKIKQIISEAIKHIMFMPADQFAIANFRSIIMTKLNGLKTRRRISGYIIDVAMTEQNSITGAITYTPINRVNDVKIDISSVNDSFNRAMKGV